MEIPTFLAAWKIVVPASARTSRPSQIYFLEGANPAIRLQGPHGRPGFFRLLFPAILQLWDFRPFLGFEAPI
jgi:hypothetical protein